MDAAVRAGEKLARLEKLTEQARREEADTISHWAATKSALRRFHDKLPPQLTRRALPAADAGKLHPIFTLTLTRAISSSNFLARAGLHNTATPRHGTPRHGRPPKRGEFLTSRNSSKMLVSACFSVRTLMAASNRSNSTWRLLSNAVAC